jgi:hypothetical protein
MNVCRYGAPSMVNSCKGTSADLGCNSQLGERWKRHVRMCVHACVSVRVKLFAANLKTHTYAENT